MLVTGKEILAKAHQEGYAVGAFNISNMEILQAIIAAAEEERSPVIIQTSEGAIQYAGIDYLKTMVHLAASKASVPVALHLDHGTTYETIISCIRNGYTSVMIDGSHHPLDENIAATNEIIKIAHAVGVSVEAELGRLGGIEDNISVDEKDARLTHPDEAVEFVKATGVDYLAIAIGTAHGKYKGKPELDFERLETIKRLLNMPIVLHGASGVGEEDIKKAVSLGINKINIDTDIRVAFTEGVKAVFKNKPEEYDPRKICGPAREDMKEVIKGKMRLFGCSGKA
ncbi:MAG: class II fructose-1,6-bisphosphate aldolase [Firmicutes bacterium]|nr:class II fructose-1,6-bisphosphate aldolase [Bacillota bacterium]